MRQKKRNFLDNVRLHEAKCNARDAGRQHASVSSNSMI
jgi:hypothetical protein